MPGSALGSRMSVFSDDQEKRRFRSRSRKIAKKRNICLSRQKNGMGQECVKEYTPPR